MITLALEARIQCRKEKIIVFIIPSHMFSIVPLTRQHSASASVWYHTLVSLSRACKYSLLFFILRWLDNMTNFLHPVSDEQRSNTERSRRKSTEFMFRNAQWHAVLASGKNTLGFSELFSVESNWRVVSGNPQKMDVWSLEMTCTWDVYTSGKFTSFQHFSDIGSRWNSAKSRISQNNTWFPVWLFPKRKNNTQNSTTEHTAGNSIYV